jgi:hypothetical protein
VLYVDLQYGNTEEALAEARAAFPDLTIHHDDDINQFKDLDAFASQVDACDVIVTICNTTAHMAGALGKPSYVLMSDVGLTWYWFENREDCLWYPSLKMLWPALVSDPIQAAAEMVKSLK